jgi:hypothetical protein
MAFLISAGADVNSSMEGGGTAIYLAAQENHIQ